jgi:hypothetical protein
MARELEDLIRDRFLPISLPDENGDEISPFDELLNERGSEQLDTAEQVLSQFVLDTGAVGSAYFWRGVNTLRDWSEQAFARSLFVLGEGASVPLRHDTQVTLTPFRPRAESQRTVSAARQQFNELVEKWREETRHLSSLTDIVLNFNYQRIIGMGPAALPFIFEELSTNGGHWFWALRAITGEDPVPPQDRGNIPNMKNAWIEWCRKHA